MTLVMKLAALASAACFAAGSPALALSVDTVPADSQAAARIVDPDEAFSWLYKAFAGSGGPEVRDQPEARGSLVTYDLSGASKSAERSNGLADLTAHPSDSDFNPFMENRHDAARSPSEGQ